MHRSASPPDASAPGRATPMGGTGTLAGRPCRHPGRDLAPHLARSHPPRL